MQCPVCKTVNLTMADRQGIEIDYCPQCRGVWLDRGELDKIIERSAGAPIPTPAMAAPQYTPPVHSAPVQSPPPPHYRADERDFQNRNYENRNYENRSHENQNYDDRDRKPYGHDPRQHGHYEKDYRYGHKRKREGFLSDLFDFD